MRTWLTLMVISLAAFVPELGYADDLGALEQPGMLVPCFFEQENGTKAGVAVFIPSTGIKDKSVVPGQIRNPDALLSSSGFDRVQIKDNITIFSGKNEMRLTFLGGEVYHAELRAEGGRKQSGTCVVGPASGVTEAMKDFDEFRLALNGQGKNGVAQ